MPLNPDGSFSYSTIGDYLDDPDFTISIYCSADVANGPGCHHGAELDLAKLAERLGREHSVLAKDLKPYFRCSQCGSKEVSFSIVHNGRPGR